MCVAHPFSGQCCRNIHLAGWQLAQLSSPAFHYTRYKKIKTKVVQKASERFPKAVGKRFRQGLPLKTGSLQTFVCQSQV